MGEVHKDVKVVFQKPVENDQSNYYVVVAARYPVPEVVTVCTTLPEVWEIIKGTLKRR